MRAILIILLLIGTIACKKQVAKVNPDYIGRWIQPQGKCYIRLTIDEDSYGDRSDQGEEMCKGGYCKGKVRLGKKNLSIGRHNYEVIEEPTPIDTFIIWSSDSLHASWRMNLKSPWYHRKIGILYKFDSFQ